MQNRGHFFSCRARMEWRLPPQADHLGRFPKPLALDLPTPSFYPRTKPTYPPPLTPNLQPYSLHRYLAPTRQVENGLVASPAASYDWSVVELSGATNSTLLDSTNATATVTVVCPRTGVRLNVTVQERRVTNATGT